MQTIVPAYDMRIDFTGAEHIYLAQKPADLRKGIDGYVSIVQGLLEADPTDGSLFLFTNRQKNKMKGVLYDGIGWWLVYKRLPQGTLSWPVSDDYSSYIEISNQQLHDLLGGMSVIPNTKFKVTKPQYV